MKYRKKGENAESTLLYHGDQQPRSPSLLFGYVTELALTAYKGCNTIRENVSLI